MADEDEDKGWLKPRGGSPFRKRSIFSTYSPSHYGKYDGSSAFKTETRRVPESETLQAYEEYLRRYPAAGYATELVRQTVNDDNTVTLVFRRYPSAD